MCLVGPVIVNQNGETKPKRHGPVLCLTESRFRVGVSVWVIGSGRGQGAGFCSSVDLFPGRDWACRSASCLHADADFPSASLPLDYALS